MTIQRAEPPHDADERTTLSAYLDYHRATLAMKCDGLDPAQLRERTVPPSSLSLLGLVRHMSEVERGWFRNTFSGQDAPPIYYSKDEPDGDFDNLDGADVDEVFATWQAECDQARTVVAEAASLGLTSARPSRGRLVTLRWILIHMIEEYARHNGHADLIRERLDGAVGE